MLEWGEAQSRAVEEDKADYCASHMDGGGEQEGTVTLCVMHQCLEDELQSEDRSWHGCTPLTIVTTRRPYLGRVQPLMAPAKNKDVHHTAPGHRQWLSKGSSLSSTEHHAVVRGAQGMMGASAAEG